MYRQPLGCLYVKILIHTNLQLMSLDTINLSKLRC
jgi:hypothetical protein